MDSNHAVKEEKTKVPSAWFYLSYASLCVVIFWVWYLLENYVGINVKGQELGRDRTPLPILVPAILTPVSFVAAYIFYRRAASFLSRAIEVSGTVVAVGSLEMKGMRHLTYSYIFEGRRFEQKRSVYSVHIGELGPGNEVAILVDPSNPESSRLVGEF